MTSSAAHPRARSHVGGRLPAGDGPAEPHEQDAGLGQRSVSLTTLQPTIIPPRMAQLETLEAKMASIEVSLSSVSRRKKSLCLGSALRPIPKEAASKELENLRNALRDKENIIQSLKGQLTIPGLRLSSIRNGSNSNVSAGCRELTEVEKKQAEERLGRLRIDVDNKRLAIKNLKMALERLDITDNIDVRIQQAELEYQLGREELNLLTLLEETRALQLCLDESNRNPESHTLYSCVSGSGRVVLLSIEVEFDPKSPRFGAGQRDAASGLWVDWALEETGMRKGDRLVEVNGKIVLMRTQEDLLRLLAAAPDPAQIVVLRKLSENSTITASTTSKEVSALRQELEVVRERAEEAQKSKDGLKSDNIRLTHRISYLEEQVAELLNRRKPDSAAAADVHVVAKTPVISTVKTSQNVTNINITSSPSQPSTEAMQVFQKGPQVTALVANLPGLENKDPPFRSKSSLSNVSNTHISAPSPQPVDFHCHKNHRHKHRSTRNLQTSISVHNLDQNDKILYRKHHHHREKDYSSETNSNIEHISRHNKRNVENGHRFTMELNKTNSEKNFSNDIMDQSYKKATKIVHDLTRSRENALYEKHRQKCLTASEKYNSDILKHYNARKSTSVIDFRSEIHIGPKYYDTKTPEELEDKSGNNKKVADMRSVKSLDFDSDCNLTNANKKNLDYTSEPLDNRKKSGYFIEGIKQRPTPPKKPLRLSLHKTQSLQSVETPPMTPSTSPEKSESRKCLKRNYRGEVPKCEQNGLWKMVENSAETGSWC